MKRTIAILLAALMLTGVLTACSGSAPAEDVLVAVRPEEFVLAADGQQGIDATVVSSVFLGLNTTYFVELYDGTNAEILGKVVAVVRRY